MPTSAPKDCPLCFPVGDVLWHDASCRVIRVDDADYPGYCRLIWNEHVAEMSDLTPTEQRHCFNILMAVEVALRECFRPRRSTWPASATWCRTCTGTSSPLLDDRHFPADLGPGQRKGGGSPARGG
jgi:hypothetical protein